MTLNNLLLRSIPIWNGVVHYKNPLQIFLRRVFQRDGLMTISDRETGVAVIAPVKSFRMFGETWYDRDYDVPACPVRPGDAVIDIGANQGFFSCYAASKGARVYAFEPFPESCMRLRANVERNGFSARVVISEAAVSAVRGTATLFCSDLLGGGQNTIIQAHANAIGREDFRKTIEVETVSIDEVLSNISGRIRLCKVDCESAEYNIIRGISDPSKVDCFAIEFHPIPGQSVRDLVEVMTAWRTHQISFAKTSYILYAVRNETLSEYADQDFPIRGR